MYINQVDTLFDNIINNFNIYLIKQNIFEKFSKDNNFVKFQNNIIDIIKEFINTLDIKEIQKLINKFVGI